MATNNCINLRAAGIVKFDGAGNFSSAGNPLDIANGGSLSSSFTAYAVLCGGVTTTSSVQSLASLGAAGTLLKSNGAGALPSFGASTNGFGYQLNSRSFSNSSPSTSTTYFVGDGVLLTTFTTSVAAVTRVYIPRSGTIVSCYGQVTQTGTKPGNTGNWTIALRLNNTTDTTITSSLQITATENTFSNTGLSISVSAGDYIEMKVSTPASYPDGGSTGVSIDYMVHIT